MPSVYIVSICLVGQISLSLALNSLEKNINLSHTIIHGEEVSEPTPYQISIQIKHFFRWEHFCGGSIISENYILTAAHCFVDQPGKSLRRLRILAGTNNLKSGGSRHKIVSYKTHPSFQSFRGSDIAVVKVSPRFEINQKTIDKINFDSKTRVLGNTLAFFTGWGATENGGSTSLLQKSTFKTLRNRKCRNKFVELKTLATTDICAVGIGLSSAAPGDSGGPLVNQDKTLLIGVSSYGYLKYVRGAPGVFTRVSPFVDWIKEEIGKTEEIAKEI